MKKLRIAVPVVLAASLFMGGCGKEIPGEIIQPDAMESLLYDYHMASTMASSLSYNESYKKEAYYEYVFRKHQVTEAEFDSSMVWYTRHSKVLADIYTRLGERFKKAEEQLKFQAEKREGRSIDVFLSGDSVDVWQDRTLYWLTPAGLTDKVAFEMKTDTTFKPMDRLELTADFSWVPAAAQDSLHTVVMGLSVEFRNDSIQGRTFRVPAAGVHKLVLQPDSAFEFEKVRGFIYFNGPSVQKSHLLVNRISLMRFHSDVEADAVAPEEKDGKIRHRRPMMDASQRMTD